jgi:RNA 2',3'-cyclic 3'-phosphodiesterase
VPRLFVAIDFPAAIKLSLSGLCSGVAGVRWVASENFHLTLRFIGEVDDATAAGIAAALVHVEMPRFALRLAGVGQFGGHTLWVGVEESAALTRLHAAIESELENIGLADADTRPYQPHVKLARSRRRRSFRAFIAEHANFCAEPFEVGNFSLIESRRGESGRIYEHRADYTLLAEAEVAQPLVAPACA